MEYSLVFKGNSWHLMPFSPKETEQILLPLFTFLKLPPLTLELWVCDDRISCQLNSRYLGSACPTNILSFPNEENIPEEGEVPFFLGSLALNAENLQREAVLYHQSVQEHCVNLLIHGLAHLLGFDHGNEMDTLCQALYTQVNI